MAKTISLKTSTPSYVTDGVVFENDHSDHRWVDRTQIVAGTWTVGTGTGDATLVDRSGKTLYFRDVLFVSAKKRSDGAALACTIASDTTGKSIVLSSPADSTDYDVYAVCMMKHRHIK